MVSWWLSRVLMSPDRQEAYPLTVHHRARSSDYLLVMDASLCCWEAQSISGVIGARPYEMLIGEDDVMGGRGGWSMNDYTSSIGWKGAPTTGIKGRWHEVLSPGSWHNQFTRNPQSQPSRSRTPYALESLGKFASHKYFPQASDQSLKIKMKVR